MMTQSPLRSKERQETIMSKTEAADKKAKKETKLMKGLVTGIIIVLTLILCCFIYFSFEVSSAAPPDSSEEERLEWFEILEHQDFVIDKAAKDTALRELLYFKISRLSFSDWNKEKASLCAEFITKGDDYSIPAVIIQGDGTLVCSIDGQSLPIWLETGSDPVIIVQGTEERLLFIPEDPISFRSRLN